LSSLFFFFFFSAESQRHLVKFHSSLPRMQKKGPKGIKQKTAIVAWALEHAENPAKPTTEEWHARAGLSIRDIGVVSAKCEGVGPAPRLHQPPD